MEQAFHYHMDSTSRSKYETRRRIRPTKNTSALWQLWESTGSYELVVCFSMYVGNQEATGVKASLPGEKFSPQIASRIGGGQKSNGKSRELEEAEDQRLSTKSMKEAKSNTTAIGLDVILWITYLDKIELDKLDKT